MKAKQTPYQKKVLARTRKERLASEYPYSHKITRDLRKIANKKKAGRKRAA